MCYPGQMKTWSRDAVMALGVCENITLLAMHICFKYV